MERKPALPEEHSLAAPLELFLKAIREDRPRDAERILGRYPGIAEAQEFGVWCVLGDGARVSAALATDPGVATRPRTGESWPPLLYACASWLHVRGEPEAAALANVIRLLVRAGADRATAINRWGEPPERMGSAFATARLVAAGLAPREALECEE